MTITNADENLILGPLSGEEIDVVRQHRARLAAPQRKITRIAISLSILVFSAVWMWVYYQALQINQHGYSGEFPAPLSWAIGAISFVKAL